MKKKGIGDANVAEIIDIVDVLIEYGVIEKND